MQADKIIIGEYSVVMDVLDWYEKNLFYIGIDNCRMQGYMALFMSPYSPFLNPSSETYNLSGFMTATTEDRA